MHCIHHANFRETTVQIPLRFISNINGHKFLPAGLNNSLDLKMYSTYTSKSVCLFVRMQRLAVRPAVSSTGGEHGG